VQKFFEFTAHEVREKLAKLGLKSLEDAIGDTSLMILKKDYKDESVKLGFDRLLDRYRPNKKQSNELKKNLINNSLSDESLNNLITKKLKTNLAKGKGGSFNFEIKNTQRSVGARLAGDIAEKFGREGFPEKIILNFKGNAGQSFGCWNSKGVELKLNGLANDYVGKGMNGGKIVITKNKHLNQERPVLVGNTCLFGATGGEFYATGVAGERFAVRNSGAKAIIEGTGDHCCEYMTGGEVIVLGPRWK
jgi:Glutamate synthase domain 3